ncbi:MAG TPA: LytR C-terminal domain-containing protein [Thermoleophilaceae bacterium]|nr:LytR C-terminal domain-containing protein [Thermoleophilaceae bacterium]
MEIVQEIGSYAGIAAVLGLAVLSALYFSQARDVKRLREWAGRAPDRAPTPAIPEPRGVVAQPIAQPPARPVPGGTPPPVPRPPGAPPASSAAAAAAAGAGPAIARGPGPVTPADGQEDGDEGLEGDQPTGEPELDVTAMDTEVHPPPAPPDEDGRDEEDGGDRTEVADAAAVEGEDAFEGEDDDLEGDREEPTDDQGTGGYAAVPPDETVVHRPGDSGEMDAVEDGDTGEWRPEDEHSDLGFTDEHDAVGPATPAASAPRPPTPPRPYQRRGAPVPATGYARGRAPILPPYAEARPAGETADAPASGGAGRRPVVLALATLVAIAVVAFGVLQLTGGDDSGGGGDAGLSAGGTGDGGATGDGGGQAPPIDPSEVTVAVLNGTTVPGLAATIGDQIVGEGFQLGTVTNNFDQERAESVVLYAPGAEREAADVGRRLDISQREPIDAESQALAGDATVVVVAGADQNQ